MENEIKNFVELPVTGGYVTKVDPDIAEKIKNKKIYTKTCRNKIYAAIWKSKKDLTLHRFVKNASPGQIVDHINGDTLDNRKINLRFCDHYINSLNRRKPSHSKAGYYGVRQDDRTSHYESYFHLKRRKYSTGSYRNKIIAVFFRDAGLLKTCKINVGLNFPNFLNEDSVYEFIESTKGKIFACWFVKRTNGSVRKILCRYGVTKHLKNKGMCYDAREKNLFVVYDFTKKNFRAIPVENVLCVRFKNKNYRVIRERQTLAA